MAWEGEYLSLLRPPVHFGAVAPAVGQGSSDNVPVLYRAYLHLSRRILMHIYLCYTILVTCES